MRVGRWVDFDCYRTEVLRTRYLEDEMGNLGPCSRVRSRKVAALEVGSSVEVVGGFRKLTALRTSPQQRMFANTSKREKGNF